MKIKIKGLVRVIMVFLALFVSEAYAGTIVVPMTTDNWTGYSDYGNVSVSATVDGIQVNGYDVGKGAMEKTTNSYDFTAAETYIKWKAHGAGGYMKVAVGVGNTDNNTATTLSASTVRSVNGSTVIADDTWYYTRIRFSPDSKYYLTATATGNYDNAGGTEIIHTDDSVASSTPFQTGVIYASISDNEGGKDAYIVIGEAKVVKSMSCGTLTEAGGDMAETFNFDMGTNSGNFFFEYDTYSVEDEIMVFYEGKQIYTTGCVGKKDSVPLAFSGTSSIITVTTNPNCTGTTGTAWNFTVSCPVGGISVQVINGKGTVVSSDNLVKCRDTGIDCTIMYKTPGNITLTAYEDLNYSFTGWGKHCKNMGKALSCTLSTWYERYVTAKFTPNDMLNKLTVTKSGRATGDVTPSGGRITWTNNTGAAYYELTDNIALTVAPATNAYFYGWDGDCNGSACTVEMSGPKSVEARFEPKAKLYLNKAGNGVGTITSSTGTITWSGKTGMEYYIPGTSLTLTAVANSGSVFSGWSNDCSGSASTCTFNILADRTVTATFNASTQQQPKLTVTKQGDGDGTVSTSAGTLAWYGNTGTATYELNTQVTLIATPSAGSTFAGWSGDCTAASNMTCTTTMSGDKSITVTFIPSGSSKTTYDFDGDGISDALWRDSSTGDIYIWLMKDTAISAGDFVVKALPLDWDIVGVGDFNGDGKSDIVLRNSQGDIYMWLMDRTKISTGGYASRGLPGGWALKATDDFDNDGKADMLWQNTSTGDVYVWLMDGANIKNAGHIAMNVGAEWELKGVADLDGDKKSDIIWQNTNNGAVFVWLMDITSISKGDYVATGISGNWQLKAVADFNGDGKADMLWQNTSTGDLYLWLMDGTKIGNGGYIKRAVSEAWQIKKVGDYNGDGKADILWQNATSGDVYVYIINGISITSEGYPTKGLASQWKIE
ncbi:VCBS repeat-containing protein [Candidatus Magnetobacterium casense]|uniref:VCBS repeat-containing protein n=1 Tax=Candidatus Magnetobacterium casense TaxID=1455061 RepID=A0ABS6RZI5_9BACT|nr:VCBS repeat-containing protein [Candidatus Magnetobacterium casensis]MBV6342060.1 VCBS repeat-containing protein [Candidatus Magnetobacterium casensis]